MHRYCVEKVLYLDNTSNKVNYFDARINKTMKQSLFIVICSIIFSVGSLGAQDEFKNIRFGPEVSPHISWMFTNDNQINSMGNNFGVRLGLMGEYYFTENYALTGGLGLAFNMGGTLKHDVGGELLSRSELSSPNLRNLDDGAEIQYSMQFVELPLGLKMKTRQFGYISYYAHLPVFTLGILTRSRGDIMASNASSTNENLSPDTRFFNVSWGFGGGAEYAVSPETSLLFGLYYQQSMIDITRDKGTLSNGEREDSKGTFGMISLRVGVLF